MNAQDIAAFDADAIAFADHNDDMAAKARRTADLVDDKRDEINMRMVRIVNHLRATAEEHETVAKLLRECHSDQRPSGSTVSEPLPQFMRGDSDAQATGEHRVTPVDELPKGDAIDQQREAA